jgi:hypothetical protein
MNESGNGTQSIAWQINEESYRKTLEDGYPQIKPSGKQDLQVYYGSLHDVLSFPCEVTVFEVLVERPSGALFFRTESLI